jgi:hypothetical protein
MVAATMTRQAVGEPEQELVENSVTAQRRLCLVWRASLGLLGLQLLGLLVFTTAQYHSFNLTLDFAAYSQAWTAIAHGHLNPYSSVFGLPFWQNDLELIMWPLALFYWLYPHAVTLLWLQAVAVVGGEIVVLAWAREALTKLGNTRRHAPRLLALVTMLLLVTPWSWFTIGFDFHVVPFATVFVLLAARDLWGGRARRLWVWVPLTLACAAAPGGLCVIAIGLAALASRNVPRRTAIPVVIAGCVWLAFASGIGAMGFRGLRLGPMYGYLTGHAGGHMGLTQIAEGLFAHPLRAVDMFRSHSGYVYGYVASGGVIGLRSLWGLLPAALVLLPSALNANPAFIHFGQAFQSWPAVLFLVAGTVLVLHELERKAGPRRRAGLVLTSCALAAAMGVLALTVSEIPGYLQRVTARATLELAATLEKIPARSEVVASQGIMGRFGAGSLTYTYWASGRPERYSVEGSRSVVFVLAPEQGTAYGFPEDTRQAINYVKTRLHARPLEEGAGIWALIWVPRVGLKSVVLP